MENFVHVSHFCKIPMDNAKQNTHNSLRCEQYTVGVASLFKKKLKWKITRKKHLKYYGSP